MRQTIPVVAALGIVIASMAGVSAERRRRRDYHEQLYYHLQNCMESPGWAFHDLPREAQDRLVASAKFHAAMAKGYATALRVPLFFVGPEPPEP